MMALCDRDRDRDRDRDLRLATDIGAGTKRAAVFSRLGSRLLADGSRSIFWPGLLCFVGLSTLTIYAYVWLATLNPSESLRRSPVINDALGTIFDDHFSTDILPASSVITGLFVVGLIVSLALDRQLTLTLSPTQSYDLRKVCVTRWLTALSAVLQITPKLVFHAFSGRSYDSINVKLLFLTSLSLSRAASLFLVQLSLYLLDYNHSIVSYTWIFGCAACIVYNASGTVLLLLDNSWAFQQTTDNGNTIPRLTVVGQLATYAPVPLLCAHAWLAFRLARHHLSKNTSTDGAEDAHHRYSSSTEWFIFSLGCTLIFPTVLRVAISFFIALMTVEASSFRAVFNAHFISTTGFALVLLVLAVWIPVKSPIARMNWCTVSRSDIVTVDDLEWCSNVACDSELGSAESSYVSGEFDDDDEQIHGSNDFDANLRAEPVIYREQSEQSVPISQLQSKVNEFTDSLSANLEALSVRNARAARARIRKNAVNGWLQLFYGDRTSRGTVIGVLPGDLSGQQPQSAAEIISISHTDSFVDGEDAASMITLCDHKLCVIQRHFFGSLVECFFDLRGRVQWETAPQQQQLPAIHFNFVNDSAL